LPGDIVGPAEQFRAQSVAVLRLRRKYANANGRTNMRHKMIIAALLATAAGPPALAQNQDVGGVQTETQRRLAQGDAGIPWDLLGLFGLLGLQSRVQVTEMETYQRTQALVLLNDMASRLATNRNAGGSGG
jgi:hypothetical protein